jgi:hypothetical protein
VITSAPSMRHTIIPQHVPARSRGPHGNTSPARWPGGASGRTAGGQAVVAGRRTRST